MARLMLQTDPCVRLLVVPETGEECELIDTGLGTETPLVVAGWLTYGEEGDEVLRLTLGAPELVEAESLRGVVLRWFERFLGFAGKVLNEPVPMEPVDEEKR